MGTTANQASHGSPTPPSAPVGTLLGRNPKHKVSCPRLSLYVITPTTPPLPPILTPYYYTPLPPLSHT